MREKLSDGFAYPPRGMELERASAYVGLGRTKFLEMVEAGRMPQPIDLDGSPRWDRFDLDRAFDDLKERRKDPVQARPRSAPRTPAPAATGTARMNINLPYVVRVKARGRSYYYFRTGVDANGRGGTRIPLPGHPGTREFQDAYQAALREHAPHLQPAIQATARWSWQGIGRLGDRAVQGQVQAMGERHRQHPCNL